MRNGTAGDAAARLSRGCGFGSRRVISLPRRGLGFVKGHVGFLVNFSRQVIEPCALVTVMIAGGSHVSHMYTMSDGDCDPDLGLCWQR